MQTISGMPDVEIYLSGEDPRFYKGGQINILLVSVGKAPASIRGDRSISCQSPRWVSIPHKDAGLRLTDTGTSLQHFPFLLCP